jgi:CTP synthase (UTP-ammonia lyase)
VSASEGARRAVIGLTTYHEPARMLVWDREFAMLHASYIAATEPGTRTAELIGPRVQVRCHHHQAVARLAPGLTVTGRAADGVVEAVEVACPSFAVGVQWHPEEDHADARLFSALVAAGQQYGAGLRRGDDLEDA